MDFEPDKSWLLARLVGEYGFENARIVRRFSSTPTREVWQVVSGEQTVAVKIDRAPDGHTRSGSATQERVAHTLGAVAEPPIRTLTGLRALEADSLRMSVSRWVTGFPPREPAGWRAVGQSLARLHTVNAARLPPFAIPYAAAIKELVQQVPDRYASTAHPLIDRVASLNLDHECLIHGEPASSNVLIVADEAILLDWDQAGVGAIALDLGFALIQEFVTTDRLPREAEAIAFYAGYVSQAGVLPADPTDIFTAALFWAARFATFRCEGPRWERIIHALSHETDIKGWINRGALEGRR